MKIISWNANGLQARMRDFFDYLCDEEPDIFALQETRLSKPIRDLDGIGYYITWYNSENKPGYSGTAILYKHKPLAVTCGLGLKKFDVEARLITLEYPDCFFVTVYVPNSQSDSVRRLFRIEWDTAFRKYINSLQRRGKNVIIAGDFNVAHQHIDIYPENTRNQENPAGFLSHERDGFEELLDLGLVDVFRQQHPKRTGAYTWWSSKFDKGQNNGRRIDYFLISESLMPNVISCDIRTDINASDHAPIELQLTDTAHNDEVLEKMWQKIKWPEVRDKVAQQQKTIAIMAYKHHEYTRRDVTRAQKVLIKSLDARLLAVSRVADRATTPGIDGVMWRTGAEKMRAALSMSTNTYIAQPSRFVTILGKKGRKDRHVHIPTVYDRAMQMLYALALDPVSESTADKKSFAFRKGRSAFDLHAHLMKILDGNNPPKFIVKADVQMYYASISHDWLIKNIPIPSTYVLGQFLKAGHVLGGELFPSKDTGISIGTSISPIIANMVLDGAQKEIHSRLNGQNFDIDYDNGALFRFADDVFITARTKATAETCLQILEDFIKERGLGFASDKTQIIDLSIDGFDLLSWHFKYDSNRRICSIPSEAAVNRFLSELQDLIIDYKGGQKSLITKINQKIQGWASYHKITDAAKTFRYIDDIINALLLRLCKKRHGWPKQRLINKYFHKINDNEYVYAIKDKPDIRVIRLTDIVPASHRPISLNRNPYIDPEYYEAMTGERLIQNATGKYKAIWTRQSGTCYYCGRRILQDEEKRIITINPEHLATSTNIAYIHSYCMRGTVEFYNCDEDEEIRCRLDFHELITQTEEQKATRRNRFSALKSYIGKQKKKMIKLKFADIEKIIDKPLCRSAYTYKSFWHRIHEAEISACWITNGYRIKELNLEKQTISLEKDIANS